MQCQHGRLGFAVRLSAGAVGWYLSSVTLTLFNKWILGYWVPSFQFPLAMTLCHMVLKGVIAATWICVRRVPLPHISLRDFLVQACPIGASTGLDIALSNLSFLFVTVSFYTMVKPLGLLFTLLLAFLLRLETPSAGLIATVLAIFVGVLLASLGQGNDCSGGGDASSLEACELTGHTYTPGYNTTPSACTGRGDNSTRETCEETGNKFRASGFSLVGFSCVLLATVFGAVRWTFTQLMLQTSLTDTAKESEAIPGDKSSLLPSKDCHDAPHSNSIKIESIVQHRTPKIQSPGVFGSGPVVLLMLISPSAALALVPLVLLREREGLQNFVQTEESTVLLQSAMLMCFASVLAFLLLSAYIYQSLVPGHALTSRACLQCLSFT